MKTFLKSAAFAAASLLALASRADATAISFTFSGTVSGTDALGIFGTAGASFSNAVFKSVYSLNTDNTTPYNYTSGTVQENLQYGSGIASITVNGANFTTNYVQDLRYQDTSGGYQQITSSTYQNIGANQVDVDNGIQGSNFNLFSSMNIGAPFTFSSATPAYGGIYEYDVNGNSLSTMSFSVTSVQGSASVPEPATWGMMVLGFGAIGFGLRRRRQTVAFG